MADVARTLEWIFLGYFGLMQVSYFALVMVAFIEILSRLPRKGLRPLPPVTAPYAPSVSIVMPAYNEEALIMQALGTMLQQDYPALQIVVVNDGSTDRTLEVLKAELSLTPAFLPPRSAVPSAPTRGVYRADVPFDILVVDKENGGSKADAVNAGINYARHDLVCIIDADTLFERDTVQRAVREFQRRPGTLAVGGTILPLNGCELGPDGYVRQARVPRNFWARIQTLEYVRAFLFGRMGWVPFNALTIISGAFGLFDRKAVVAVGAYSLDAIGEDMDLTMKLHLWAREHQPEYHIGFVATPVAWTEVPESVAVLRQQRIRWHRGLSEVVTKFRGTTFRHGALGWLSFPSQVVFEWLSAILETLGYVVTLMAWAMGWISDEAVVAFLILAVGLSMLLSVASVLLEEIALRIYPGRDVVRLCLTAVVENLGYRQMHAAWRSIGFFQWAFGAKHSW
ncbi:MAG: glycosyltransferase family 2 protein [Rhodothermales bacterium]|nr:glycosyltransferase family 2 protein [Rhodothermales bacterium]MBO6780653.1 glycosyltransferase family 2 protein [Rhodothermales bacterium]